MPFTLAIQLEFSSMVKVEEITRDISIAAIHANQ